MLRRQQEGYNFDEAETKQAIQLLDTNNDGLISFEEFVDWATNKVQDILHGSFGDTSSLTDLLTKSGNIHKLVVKGRPMYGEIRRSWETPHIEFQYVLRGSEHR